MQTCECIYEPRGDFGLEGYDLREEYQCERKMDHSGKYYWRVYYQEGCYETVSVRGFNKHFKLKS
jgi:hypothetical protein